ncbi:MAG TPA: hypothetical protein VFT45_17125 [Longimicrobium sp.]|nr:hypothetical protein [Longimicrobium sp.]
MITLENFKILKSTGMPVYADDTAPDVFYLVANAPRFRTDNEGRPCFNFIKYVGDEVDSGGGLCLFDTEFTPWPEQEKAAREEVEKLFAAELDGRPVRFATPVYLDGTAKLLIQKDDGLVEEVVNEGRPSLVGRNVTSFNVRLSAAGAQVFEAALSKGGGLVQVVYDLAAPARLGGVHVEVSYDASQVYTFAERISAGGWDGFDKRIEEERKELRSGTVKIDFTGAPTAFSEQARTALREWATKALQEQQSRELAKLEGFSPEQQKQFEDEARAYASRRGIPYGGWWYWHWRAGHREVSNLSRLSSQSVGYHVVYDERSTILWRIVPQGMLPSFERMGLPWEQYRREVRLNDPFFQQVRSTLKVNADFDALGIASVQVHVRYAGRERSWTFTDPDTTQTFVAARTDGDEFTYRFVVNYAGSSTAFESGERTARGDVSVNVGSLGLLSVQVIPSGGLAFGDDLTSARVEVRYEDPERRLSLERQLTIDAANVGDALRLTAPVGTETLRPYSFRIVYDLSDTQVVVHGKERSEPFLYVAPPFAGSETLEVVGEGIGAGVKYVDVTAVYADDENGYRRTRRMRLNADNEREVWTVPVVARGKGAFAYEATVVYDEAGRPPRRVPRTPAGEEPVYVGERPSAARTAVVIRSAPGLWERVDAVSLDLCCRDATGAVTHSRHFDFEAPEGDPGRGARLGEWQLDRPGGKDLDYEWSAEFVLSNGDEVSASGPGQGMLVLRLPPTA